MRRRVLRGRCVTEKLCGRLSPPAVVAPAGDGIQNVGRPDVPPLVIPKLRMPQKPRRSPLADDAVVVIEPEPKLHHSMFSKRPEQLVICRRASTRCNARLHALLA